jgi:[acyl-carrier-protein] S-malonyltransferase
MTTALVFPGQGSQAIGMGVALAAAFPAAKDVLAEVDDALSQPLSKLMAEGPEAELTSTENAQPAIMAASLAAFRVMERELGFKIATQASCVAGHSLGEYSALTAAGSLTVPEAARLLRTRGNAMQKAVPAGRGGMVAVIGPDIAEVEAIVIEARNRAAGEVIEIANHNSTNQIVLSGECAVPLLADGPRRIGDERRARGGGPQSTGCAAYCQCHRRAHFRPGIHQGSTCPASDWHGALGG